MAEFVECLGNRARGYPQVNLDHVTTLVRDSSPGPDDPMERWRCLDRQGESMGVVENLQLPSHPVTVIADTTRAILIEFKDDGALYRHPVLAWVVKHGSAEPVICDEQPDVYCVEFRAHGLWVFPYSAVFDDWDEACQFGMQERVSVSAVEKRRRAEKAAERAKA